MKLAPRDLRPSRGKLGSKRSVRTDPAGICVRLAIGGVNLHNSKLLQESIEAHNERAVSLDPDEKEQLCLNKAYTPALTPVLWQTTDAVINQYFFHPKRNCDLTPMNTNRQTTSLIRRLFNKASHAGCESQAASPTFSYDARSGLKSRAYASYEEYLQHQGSKLAKVLDNVQKYDNEYESIVTERYQQYTDWHKKAVLCLAARLGGEVRAFKTLGALAIGIDIEPGEKNPHVLHGDFHHLQFADEVFDFAFSNAIDHVYDVPRFLSEVRRVLKDSGELILEVSTKAPGKYEVIDISTNLDSLISVFASSGFDVKELVDMSNETGYANWEGKRVSLTKSGRKK